MQIPFVGDAYLGRSTSVDTSRSINFYPEVGFTKNPRTPIAMIGTSGTQLWKRLGTGAIRGMYRFGDYLFAVSGTKLYRIDATGVVLEVGDLNTNIGPVGFTDNGISSQGVGGDQMLIYDYTYGYIYNITDNTMTPHASPNFPQPAYAAAYMDGYIIASSGNMGITVSELYNASTFNGLAIAAAIATPDNIRNIVNLHQNLFIIKEYSTELWYNTGLATQDGCPFARISGAVIDYGSAAKCSVARANNSIYMLANQRIGDGTGSFIGVVEINGMTPTVVSPPPIVYRMSQLTDIADAEAIAYVTEGHTFYQVTFPTSNVTFVYDASTQMWHERSTYTTKGEVDFDIDGVPSPKTSLPQQPNRHLASCYSNFVGKHLVGDYRTGNIYEMSSTIYNDNTEPIISTRISPVLFDKDTLNEVFISSIEVDAEVGVGDGTTYLNPFGLGYLADGSVFADNFSYAGATIDLTTAANPNARLSWSNDGGKTWSAEYEASMGKQGEYSVKMIWRRLGNARNRAFKLTISSRVKKVITGAVINGSE